MELLKQLFTGYPDAWGGGVAHAVFVLSLIIAFGIALGKLKIKGIALGSTWILFVAITFGHFGIQLDRHLLHFLKEFGLILFVYSIGLQVGLGFFSAFKKGGFTLNMLAVGSVLLSVSLAVILYFTTGMPVTTLVGVLSGAVTNTPGLGAAQQAYSDMMHVEASDIAMGYAVSYPIGVVGAILTLLALKYIFRINETEEAAYTSMSTKDQESSACTVTLKITNEGIHDKKIKEIHPLVNRKFVISRIQYTENKQDTQLVDSETKLHLDDKVLIICAPVDVEAITAFLGKKIDMEWEQTNKELVSRRILITKSDLHGKTLSELNIRKSFAVNITRVNRSGVELIASPSLQLQIGDRVTVVGSKSAISHVENLLGNSMKRLNHPNLVSIFIGIALGCILGSIPFSVPGIPQPVKLGLAGGPLIVSILIGCFGPRYKIITYTTASANLMIREIGISLFLACVGLEAGTDFVSTLVNEGGWVWVGYGALITILPLVLMGFIGRYLLHLNYYTLIGVLSGANTNPPALAFSNDQTSCDAPAVGYATVYPLSMFLRVLTAQLLILCFL